MRRRCLIDCAVLVLHLAIGSMPVGEVRLDRERKVVAMQPLLLVDYDDRSSTECPSGN